MGHRAKDKHKPRHRQHENKPPNLSQGSRTIKSIKRAPTTIPQAEGVLPVLGASAEITAPMVA